MKKTGRFLTASALLLALVCLLSLGTFAAEPATMDPALSVVVANGENIAWEDLAEVNSVTHRMVVLENDCSEITIKPEVNPGATVTVNNGAPINVSEGFTAPIPVSSTAQPKKTYTIEVTEGATETRTAYTLDVFRKPSSKLSSVKLNDQELLGPASGTELSVKLKYDATSANLKLSAVFGESALSASLLRSGASTPEILYNTANGISLSGLTVGDNVVTVYVNAGSGDWLATETYTIHVYRCEDPTLTRLQVKDNDGHTLYLDPSFATNKFAYTLFVYNRVESLAFTPEFTTPGSTVEVTGHSSLAVGANTVKVKVTTPSDVYGSTIEYVITVTRGPAMALDSLSFPEGTLTPAFSPATREYILTIPYSVKKATPALTFDSDVLTVDTSAFNGEFMPGSNVVYIRLTPKSGYGDRTQPESNLTDDYKITVVRASSASSSCTISAVTGWYLTPGSASLTSVSLRAMDGVNTSDIGFSTNVHRYVTLLPANATTFRFQITTGDRLSTAHATYSNLAGSGTVDSVRDGQTLVLDVPLTADGRTTVTFEVVAEDGTTKTSSYEVILIRQGGGLNARCYLIDLTTVGGYQLTYQKDGQTMTGFYPGTYKSGSNFYDAVTDDVREYSLTVPYEVTSVEFIPTLASEYSVWTSYADSSTLTPGGTVDVTVLVYGNDYLNGLNYSNFKRYTIHVTRKEKPSDDAGLISLQVKYGDNTIATTVGFDPSVLEYEGVGILPNTVTRLDVVATPRHAGATVTKIEGAGSLVDGKNVITITVTAEDGTTTKTYKLTVMRENTLSSDATLKNLILSADGKTLTFTAPFTGNVFEYTVSDELPYTVGRVDVAFVTNHEGATALVGGGESLKDGVNYISVVVTAQDGITTQSYKISVTRAAAPVIKSSDSTLKSLVLDGLTLTPEFDPAVTTYSVAVANSVTSVIVNPTVNHEKASYQVTVPEDGLAVGENTVTVVVTAEDGTTTTYTVKIIRAAGPENPPEPPDDSDSDCNLTYLKLVNVKTGETITLDPVFSSDVTEYTAITSATTSVKFSAGLSSENAIWMLGNWSGGSIYDVKAGENKLKIIVKAKDGSKKTYTINLTVEADDPVLSTDATLKNILINGSIPTELTPVFNPSILNYTLTVPNSVDTITVGGTASAEGANVSTRQFSLMEGTNTVSVVVIAPDHSTVLTYTITVTRTPSVKPVSGIVVISGTSKVGSTLTVNFIGEATVTFDWYADGVKVGSGETYTVTQADAGKTITVMAVGFGSFTGTIVSEPVTVSGGGEVTTQPPSVTDPTTPSGEKQGVPTIVIILIAVGCVGLAAAFVLFMMRNGRRH